MTRRARWYLYISIFVTVAILAFTVFCCMPALKRLVNAFIDLGISVAFYFCGLYALFTGAKNTISPTVINLPSDSVAILFPETFDGFVVKMQAFGQAFITEDNFFAWLSYLGDRFYNLLLVLIVVVFLILVLLLIFKIFLSGRNTDHDVKTKPLKVWLRIVDVVILPVRRFWLGYKEYVAYYRLWRWIWLAFLLVALNVATIIIEILAYVFYFAMSFDFINLYTQVYKLFVDLYIMYNSLPLVIWLYIALRFVLWWRRRIGYRKLNHYEYCNTVFARTLGVCTMITANMGKGKTKFMTSLSLTLTKIFKDDSKDILMQIERWFPQFHWATMQDTLKNLIDRHVIYSFTTAEMYIQKKKKRFEEKGSVAQLFGYDYKKYGLHYNNELQLIYLLDVLEDYAKAFFVYYLTKSMILANFSIREDGIMQDLGNLPMWDYNYFSRSPLYEVDLSYYANILDFDVLRKGKKLVKGSRLADTFEFGIVSITELDKERGNTLDMKELKKNSEETNQKNDLFNYSPKMGRHPATILFKYFTRFLFDQQRAMKSEADIREICDKVLDIGDVQERNLAMPFFFIEEILYYFIAPRYQRLYESYRFRRGDNSLIMYLIKNTLGRFVNWYERVYNIFGYDLMTLNGDCGKLDGSNITKDKWRSIYKIDLAHRYATDCYKEFFRKKSAQKDIGITDYETFAGVNASAEELLKMNSYFIRDMVEKICGDED